MLEGIITSLYRSIKKFYRASGLQTLHFDAFLVRFICEPLIAIMALFKGYHLFAHENWGTRLRYLLGWYEYGTLEVAKKLLKQGMNALDIGADVGYFARAFARSVGPSGHIWAFEPHPESFALLEQNTSGLASTITCVNKAISDTADTVTLFAMNVPGKHSLLDVEQTTKVLATKKKINVQSIPLDAYLKTQGDPIIHCIKIDIEGAELKALKGMRQTIERLKDLMMIVEFNARAIRAAKGEPEDFVKHIKALGFQIFVISESTGTLGPITQKVYDYIEEGYVNLLCVKGAFVNRAKSLLINSCALQ